MGEAEQYCDAMRNSSQLHQTSEGSKVILRHPAHTLTPGAPEPPDGVRREGRRDRPARGGLQRSSIAHYQPSILSTRKRLWTCQTSIVLKLIPRVP